LSLTPNEIEDASRDENQCIIAVKRSRELSQLIGAFPIHIDYPITAKQYEKNQKKRWPGNPLETITPSTYWPAESNESAERETTPVVVGATTETLKEIFELANRPETDADDS
jgi:hypothetical protein